MANSTELKRRWSVAFAKQAKADFESWDRINEIGKKLPECQKLHFLQMACEKLCKAHLYISGSVPGRIQSSHAFVAKHLPTIMKQFLVDRGRGSSNQRQQLLRRCKPIAREIELLHPDVDDNGRRPENCEYPWIDDSGRIIVPAESTFAVARSLQNPAEGGLTSLKCIKESIDNLSAGKG